MIEQVFFTLFIVLFSIVLYKLGFWQGGTQPGDFRLAVIAGVATPAILYANFHFGVLLIYLGNGLGQGLFLLQIALAGNHYALRLRRTSAVH